MLLLFALLASDNPTLKTLYFGGGSPALCDLTPLKGALAPLLNEKTEFTVELHPLDVTPAKLDELKSIGVNRISMGVQSLDDDILRAMGRGYTASDASRAFVLVKSHFDNAGIDLILGYPCDPTTRNAEALLAPLANWGLRHCSVYSLQNERGRRHKICGAVPQIDRPRTLRDFQLRNPRFRMPPQPRGLARRGLRRPRRRRMRTHWPHPNPQLVGTDPAKPQ